MAHPESVTVIAVVGDDVLLVRQPRPGAPEPTLELPSGKVEEGETPLRAALRELREECGWTATGSERIGAFWAAPAYSTERVSVVAAFEPEPHPDGAAPEDDEQIELVRRPLADLPHCLADATSIAAFALWERSVAVR